MQQKNKERRAVWIEERRSRRESQGRSRSKRRRRRRHIRREEAEK